MNPFVPLVVFSLTVTHTLYAQGKRALKFKEDIVDSSSSTAILEELSEEDKIKHLRHTLFNDHEIIRIQPFLTKANMVLIILEFNEPLKHPMFNGKRYALLKWTQGRGNEPRINNLVNDIQGILPAIGYTFDQYTLDTLLGIERSDFESLLESIHQNADRAARFRVNSNDSNQLMFMPFPKMLSLDTYLNFFEPNPTFFDEIGRFLRPSIEGLNRRGIAHGDLALRNIGVLLDESNPNKILGYYLFDFGSNRCTDGLEITEAEQENNLDTVLSNAREQYEKKKLRLHKRKREDSISSFFGSDDTWNGVSPLKLYQSITGDFSSAMPGIRIKRNRRSEIDIECYHTHSASSESLSEEDSRGESSNSEGGEYSKSEGKEEEDSPKEELKIEEDEEEIRQSRNLRSALRSFRPRIEAIRLL